jgi:uncharacterized protein YecT (DUF1311 family)
MHLLDAEQRAWTAWRNAHCDVVAFAVEETSAETQIRADCRTPLAIQRTRYLRGVGRQ